MRACVVMFVIVMMLCAGCVTTDDALLQRVRALESQIETLTRVIEENAEPADYLVRSSRGEPDFHGRCSSSSTQYHVYVGDESAPFACAMREGCLPNNIPAGSDGEQNDELCIDERTCVTLIDEEEPEFCPTAGPAVAVRSFESPGEPGTFLGHDWCKNGRGPYHRFRKDKETHASCAIDPTCFKRIREEGGKDTDCIDYAACVEHPADAEPSFCSESP